MAVFGKNGFIRQQEIAFAKKLLVWKFQKTGTALPDDALLSAHAEKIVADAHVIARKRGKNILEIVKHQIDDFKK
ncbi:hypothetical protein [Desulfotignum phosphitoxidans]|jgi:hypothetical protein|uniref:Uncharacterized protein n=1 Tax=Desulfotignum phosphitoxidans DSM 13687 TaxID=1286635 RepID=S0G1F7_9BACT|nr:hypothetical protein [Desulfotignum phosphitoxidans]EMS80745.1 hypothetical protein Dpo_2c04410 [Desulfotignum phosphitoxidans DSM 13687]MCF8087745.1 hypothetical protein [Desulfotignum sp.]MCF8139056.1 hypothetical protein [Desulfotignum sp.]